MSNASAVSICSNALQRLGGNPISDFEDPNKFAATAGNLWPTVRDALLRAHPWNCATKRVVLAPQAEAPAFDFGQKFLLPGDFLKLLQVGKKGYKPDYRVEERAILCSAQSLPLVYIFRNEVCSSWDDALVEVAELRMAAALAYTVTASTSLRDSYNQEADVMLKRARAADGQDDPPEDFGESPLTLARY